MKPILVPGEDSDPMYIFVYNDSSICKNDLYICLADDEAKYDICNWDGETHIAPEDRKILCSNWHSLTPNAVIRKKDTEYITDYYNSHNKELPEYENIILIYNFDDLRYVVNIRWAKENKPSIDLVKKIKEAALQAYPEHDLSKFTNGTDISPALRVAFELGAKSNAAKEYHQKNNNIL